MPRAEHSLQWLRFYNLIKEYYLRIDTSKADCDEYLFVRAIRAANLATVFEFVMLANAAAVTFLQ